VAVHTISDSVANGQLDIFRNAFLSMFPLVHIPVTMSASELRQEKPFLWLVIMALTTKMVSEQFAMEETIWDIISKRIVRDQLADLDLLIGVLAFTCWSVSLSHALIHGIFADRKTRLTVF
jgi:hypothetical protein